MSFGVLFRRLALRSFPFYLPIFFYSFICSLSLVDKQSGINSLIKVEPAPSNQGRRWIPHGKPSYMEMKLKQYITSVPRGCLTFSIEGLRWLLDEHDRIWRCELDFQSDATLQSHKWACMTCNTPGTVSSSSLERERLRWHTETRVVVITQYSTCNHSTQRLLS